MEEEAVDRPSDHLFNVVYDPIFDRFFLEDEAVYRGRSRTLDRKAVSIPWQQWILPPKSPSKQGNDKPEAPVSVKNGDQQLAVPTLDFSSFQAETIPVTSKKARVQNYAAHFKRGNQEVAQFLAARVDSAEACDDHEVKWNGEILRVQIPILEREIPTPTKSDEPNALERELVRAGEQWPGSTFDLKTLSRVRAHGDGLRRVNSANRFVAVSSSESSESEEEVIIPPKESEDEKELMPVFFRDDRVLFHARRRWFKGTVRRRIPKSDFYTIRADNGSLFDAVLATKMELIDEPEELPYFHYRKGDKVLWIPESTHAPNAILSRSSKRKKQHSNNSDEEELTYKAKIVQVRSLNRFDVLLRTGRVVKKVPYEQLRPRDESEFVSTTTSRHR